MNALARTVDRFFDRSGAALKAFTVGSMEWTRGVGYYLLPRTRNDYGHVIGQGLNSSLVVIVVGWVMRNFVQPPLRIRTKKRVGGQIQYEEIDPSLTGPGAMLRLMEYPNTFYSGRLMMKAMVIDYETTGECFVAKLRNGSGRVVELWWLPAMYVEPKWSQSGDEYIGWYNYSPNGLPIRIEPDDMIHIRDGLDPRNTRRGFNKLAALVREIYTDEEAANFSATLLTNLGVPGVIISPKDTGVASRNRIEDPEGVKDSYMEKFGGDRRGEPLILTSPTEVQILSFSPEQMKLTELRRLPEERVAAAIGVPAVVAQLGAGLDRSTYANMEEARQAAYEEKIIPMGIDWATDLKIQLLIDFVGDVTGYEVDFDLTNVRVLQEDQSKLVTRELSKLTAGAITRRVFKENVGEDADDNDDVYYIPTNLTVVNAEEPPPLLEAEQEETIVLPTERPETPLLGAGQEAEEAAPVT